MEDKPMRDYTAKPNFVDVCTQLHVAGFEAFEHSDYSPEVIWTNCPTVDFLCCGMIVETGLDITPDKRSPGWFILTRKVIG
jgi:hypothetical protein